MKSRFEALHAAAVRQGRDYYIDPETGYRVTTELGHKRRGSCCGCGCRHCPYGHENVPADLRKRTESEPELVGAKFLKNASCDALFWSGGKDSYLAWRYLQREPEMRERDAVLLTTFDARTQIVAHQQIPLARIREQSAALGAPLLTVPLRARVDYLERVKSGLNLLNQRCRIKRLIFGDLHLESIRNWREDRFAPLAKSLGLTLHFPIWGRKYSELMDEFVASGASAEITAAPLGDFEGRVRVGDRFGPEFASALPAGVDAFGERGEFHTRVDVPRR